LVTRLLKKNILGRDNVKSLLERSDFCPGYISMADRLGDITI